MSIYLFDVENGLMQAKHEMSDILTLRSASGHFCSSVRQPANVEVSQPVTEVDTEL